MTHPLRIVFAGTPEFAARPLQTLLEHDWRPLAVFTQPDRPAGRGRQASQSPVKQVAQDAGLPVFQPQTLRDDDAVASLTALQPDLLIVIAYGLILPQSVLSIPRLGCVNVHASLLPRWRGAAPIQRAIEAGDRQSGVTLMAMDTGLDTGDMISERSLTLDCQTTGGSLHDALADMGTELLLDFLPNADARIADARPQPESGITYARKLEKAEARLDWQQPALALERRVRAFNPWPVTWFQFQQQPVRVWAAEIDGTPTDLPPGTVSRHHRSGLAIATAEGSLIPTRIQPAGKKPMDVKDWLRGKGQALTHGEVLS